MPGPNYVLDKGFIQDAAVNQFEAVKLATLQHATKSSVAGEACIGISQETVSTADATAGRVSDVRIMGISRAKAAVAITIGARVRSNGDGTLTTLAATTAKQEVVGIALTAAGATNDHFDVLLTPGAQADT